MMSYTRMVQQSYLASLLEKQEMAFIAWRNSGYRDFAAHDEWLSWRNKAMNVKAEMRKDSKLANT
jgi:hypothetical protein